MGEKITMTTLEELIARKNSLLVKFMTIKNELDDIENKITDIVTPPLVQLREIQGKETGVITAIVQGFTVKQDVPKRVIWDEAKLSIKYAAIVDNGDDADKYIKRVERYSVSEKDFLAFPPEIQGFFKGARTIDKGTPKITIERKDQ